MSDTLIPRIAVISCGGTISSFGTSNLDVMDYPDEGRKLAVHEVLAHVPEVGQIAQIVPVTFRDAAIGAGAAGLVSAGFAPGLVTPSAKQALERLAAGGSSPGRDHRRWVAGGDISGEELSNQPQPSV
jgi:L-asparaginase/Glu-tRNA(Gln) amidotransferase subunit D